jgi:hypothetical protein
MKRIRLPLAFVFGVLLGAALPAPAQERAPLAQHPYAMLEPKLETRQSFATDIEFPGGPAFRVKVYDWVIGPRQELSSFPLEGFATIEVKAGEVVTMIDGATVVRHEGEHWVVPEGARLSIRPNPEAERGDNVVSLRGVVMIRK